MFGTPMNSFHPIMRGGVSFMKSKLGVYLLYFNQFKTASDQRKPKGSVAIGTTIIINCVPAVCAELAS